MPSMNEVVRFLEATCSVDVLERAALKGTVDGLAGLLEAGPGTVAFAKMPARDAVAPISTAASVLIADERLELDTGVLKAAGVAVIAQAANPRLEFARLAEALFTDAPKPGVHPDAMVHPEAVLAEGCAIGAGAYVGRARIGSGSVIGTGARILDDVTIGEGCVIYPNATLGGDGFGFERDEHGVPVKFPQRGRIMIGDRVEIGGNTCVDRGALSDTVIADDVKIDNLVHIAHNVRIGRCTLIAAGALVAGSSVLGERVWVGPSATISNGLTVGDDAQITLGSVVTRDVPAGGRVSGNFAVSHDRFLSHMRSIR